MGRSGSPHSHSLGFADANPALADEEIRKAAEKLGITSAGLQIRGSKFQSLNSNSRELELTNSLGLVLGCIEAKLCK